MPLAYSRSMKQVATYWPPGTSDGFGEKDFAGVVPVRVMCRFQPSEEVMIDANGDQITASHVVFSDTPMEIGGFILEGETWTEETDDPRQIAGAREVRRVQRYPSLRYNFVLHAAYV